MITRQTFVPGDYEIAHTSRYRVIVEREEDSMLLKKTDDGKFVLPPDLVNRPSTKETRVVFTYEVEDVDMIGLIGFLSKNAGSKK